MSSEPWFVDVHSHVVPSGDDGAQTVEEGRRLCVEALRHGTRLLFATPHVWPDLPLTRERERAVRERYAAVEAAAGLELRLGFELTPSAALLAEDPARYRLAGTDFVLMEVPFAGPARPLFALAAHVEAAGLRPVIAHPERSEAGQERPELGLELAERGWAVQVNASSLTGRHGATCERIGWELVERGAVSLVASDGHRAARPPHLDEAYALARERLGEAATALFDGSALGLAAPVSARSIPSRAASRGA
jgi:protein-tyrosine phosphatase